MRRATLGALGPSGAATVNTILPRAFVALPRRALTRAILVVGIFSLGVNLLMLATPLYMLQIFDRVLSSSSVETLLLMSLILALALACQAAVDLSRGLILSRTAAWLEADLGGRLLAAAFRRAARGGPASAQGLRDLAAVRGFVASPGIFPLFDVPWTPVFLLVIFLLDPLLGGLGLLAVATMTGLAAAGERLTRADLRRAAEGAIDAHNAADHALANADAVQAMGMLPALVARWNRAEGDVMVAFQRGMTKAGSAASVSRMLRFAFQAAIYGLGAWLVLAGRLTPGGMIAAAVLAGRALAPIDGAAAAWRQGAQALDAWRRVKSMLAEAPAPPSGLALPRPAGRLEIEQVTFAYPGQTAPLLRAVSASLRPGEALAVVGPAASGKTTLARLVVGNLRPLQGHMRLDGIEMSQWSPDERGRHVGYLPQDIELFAGTVRENIARMTAATDGVVEAAELVGAHDMIARLPRQYETPVGPRGMELSGGQRQLVGLARAVFGNPSLLVLDEPNSNLDQEGEAALAGCLKGLRERGTTAVVVTHRLSLARLADFIMVLGGGRVQALGPAAEVLPKLVAPTRLARAS
jgi:PrtD family type I secretion system ABC transporter